jgi:uncharacterized protein
MIIRLKDILRGPRHFDFSFDSGWWREGDANDQILGLDGLLKVQMTLSREGKHYAVDGELSGRIRVRCDRCLGLYSHELQSEFKLLLSPPPTEPVRSEIELLEEDMSVDFLSGDEIEIDHIVREQLYLALPIKLLCHEECRGLCPVCGISLNRGECSCSQKKGHPAFLKLNELKFNRD